MQTKQINAQERDFDNFLASLTFDASNKELTPEKREERRSKADEDDLTFVKTYFPKIFNEPFNPLHKCIAGLKQGSYNIAGARLFGKSTITYFTKIIKPLALGVGGIINLNLRTQELAVERTALIKKIIEKNQLLIYDYEIIIQQDKKGYYIINNTYFIAGSMQTGLRSLVDENMKRVRVSINDDLYSKETVKSELDNKTVVEFITAEADGILEPDGLRIFLGNMISEKCPMATMKKKFPDNYYELAAVDSKGETNWKGHSIFTKQYWADFKNTKPLSIWMGEYMNKPLVNGETLDPKWIRKVDISTYNIIAAISAIDPSFGKSPEACLKGIATLGLTDKGQIIMLDMYLRKEDYFNVFEYIHELRKRIPNWKLLLFENDFSQYYIAEPYYNSWMEATKKVLPIVLFSSKSLKTEHFGSDKISRIMNLIHPHQTGNFLYNQEITENPDFELYYNQYLSFGGTKEKLDGLDAAASAFIMIRRYADQGNSIRSIVAKKMKKQSFLSDF